MIEAGSDMTWPIRIVLAGIFLAVMAGVRLGVHAAVDAGPIPWLLMMGGIFAAALAIENAGRRAEQRPLYSWSEARELIMPLGCLAAILVVAALLRGG
jgi:hypothetical protein